MCLPTLNLHIHMEMLLATFCSKGKTGRTSQFLDYHWHKSDQVREASGLLPFFLIDFYKGLLLIEKTGYFPRPWTMPVSLRDHTLHMPAYRSLLPPERIPSIITTVSIFDVEMGEKKKKPAAKLLDTRPTPNQNMWKKTHTVHFCSFYNQLTHSQISDMTGISQKW